MRRYTIPGAAGTLPCAALRCAARRTATMDHRRRAGVFVVWLAVALGIARVAAAQQPPSDAGAAVGDVAAGGAGTTQVLPPLFVGSSASVGPRPAAPTTAGCT